MKKGLFFSLILFCVSAQNYAQVFDSQNVGMLSRWFNPNQIGGSSIDNKYSGLWAWADTVKNKEYAIVGSASGIYFVDVTDPANPVQKDFVPGKRDSCVWREIKSYDHYCYVVSDDNEPNSFQIIDMQYLPDSVHVVYDSDTLFARTHAIYIDTKNAKLYGAHVTGGSIEYSPMVVYDLTNPVNPQVLRKLSDDVSSAVIGYAHDMFAKDDTIYLSAGYQGFFVFKQTGTNPFQQIGLLTQYPENGYNHSSWMTQNGKNMVMCDEVPTGLAAKTIDISDLSNIDVKSTFRSNVGATAHNPFVIGNDFVVVAYYHDGVQIFDISDISNPVRTGFFDTYYQNAAGVYTNPNYAGCWGAYPYLPSKNILALDMTNGLFVLDASLALGLKNDLHQQVHVNIFPNPTNDIVRLKFENANTKYDIEVYDVLGQCIYSQKQIQGYLNINLTNQNHGVYSIKVSSKSNISTYKVVKN